MIVELARIHPLLIEKISYCDCFKMSKMSTLLHTTLYNNLLLFLLKSNICYVMNIFYFSIEEYTGGLLLIIKKKISHWAKV